MASAIEWDKVVYSNIENSIQLPEINNDLAISIVSCGAKANASATHNRGITSNGKKLLRYRGSTTGPLGVLSVSN